MSKLAPAPRVTVTNTTKVQRVTVSSPDPRKPRYDGGQPALPDDAPVLDGGSP